MGIRKKKFNGEEYEILDHTEKPGFRTAFHVILCIAVVYFIYIFSHLSQ
ncbi:MAG: hypothetical protein KKE62_06630 [Proteobacteria bacterium]|nr:hypothetical protein [Pseudomonadota bacterium]MBU1386603.1 hypothetical protein [Pseudomonadota bacterium]MBU1542504.1 hypothetical protein [Pseudomonadota bacterium]MBU2481534.1 hypothetical protein [Pseudomonadota bacterium]